MSRWIFYDCFSRETFFFASLHLTRKHCLLFSFPLFTFHVFYSYGFYYMSQLSGHGIEKKDKTAEETKTVHQQFNAKYCFDVSFNLGLILSYFMFVSSVVSCYFLSVFCALECFICPFKIFCSEINQHCVQKLSPKDVLRNRNWKLMKNDFRFNKWTRV